MCLNLVAGIEDQVFDTNLFNLVCLFGEKIDGIEACDLSRGRIATVTAAVLMSFHDHTSSRRVSAEYIVSDHHKRKR